MVKRRDAMKSGLMEVMEYMPEIPLFFGGHSIVLTYSPFLLPHTLHTHSLTLSLSKTVGYTKNYPLVFLSLKIDKKIKKMFVPNNQKLLTSFDTSCPNLGSYYYNDFEANANATFSFFFFAERVLLTTGGKIFWFLFVVVALM